MKLINKNMSPDNEDKVEKEKFFKRRKKVIKAISVGVAIAVSTALVVYFKKKENVTNSKELGEIDFNDFEITFNSFFNGENDLKVINNEINEFEEINLEVVDVEENISECVVLEHKRRLPDGFQASKEKKQEAREKGIPLEENETLVDRHNRRKVAA